MIDGGEKQNLLWITVMGQRRSCRGRSALSWNQQSTLLKFCFVKSGVFSLIQVQWSAFPPPDSDIDFPSKDSFVSASVLIEEHIFSAIRSFLTFECTTRYDCQSISRLNTNPWLTLDTGFTTQCLSGHCGSLESKWGYSTSKGTASSLSESLDSLCFNQTNT